MTYDVDADETWLAEISGAGPELQLRYTCPQCTRQAVLNHQAPTPEEPITTELWCHRCQIGTAAILTATEE